jgi:hypothetical protein
MSMTMEQEPRATPVIAAAEAWGLLGPATR